MIFEQATVGREEEPRGLARRLKKRDFPQDCRGLLPSPGEADIRPGCSQGRDAESAAMLQGKLFTAVNKFLTTSPLVNKIKLLIVSFYFFSLSLSFFLSLFLCLSVLLSVCQPLSSSHHFPCPCLSLTFFFAGTVSLRPY